MSTFNNCSTSALDSHGYDICEWRCPRTFRAQGHKYAEWVSWVDLGGEALALRSMSLKYAERILTGPKPNMELILSTGGHNFQEHRAGPWWLDLKKKRNYIASCFCVRCYVPWPNHPLRWVENSRKFHIGKDLLLYPPVMFHDPGSR